MTEKIRGQHCCLFPTPSSLPSSSDRVWTSPAFLVLVCFQLWAAIAPAQEKAAWGFLEKCLFSNRRKEAWSASALYLSPLNVERWEYLFRICSFSLPLYKVWNRIILSPHHLIICSFPCHGSWTSCLSFSSPPGKELTLSLSVHSNSPYLVSIYRNDCWAAQTRNSGVWGGPEGLGSNDEGLVLVSGKPWNLTREACREGFQGLIQKGGATQWSQGHRGRRGPFWSNPPCCDCRLWI